MSAPTNGRTLQIEYREIEGYHIFTSPDVYGLYIATKDPARAQALIAPSAAELLARNERLVGTIDCTPRLGDFAATFRPADSQS
jgi:hypothetical protein